MINQEQLKLQEITLKLACLQREITKLEKDVSVTFEQQKTIDKISNVMGEIFNILWR